MGSAEGLERPEGAEESAAWEALPEDVSVAPEVDMGAADPARVTPTMRQCVSTRKKGGRCPSPAMHEGLLCAVHAGRLDASAGGAARAAQTRKLREAAEERVAERRMGLRAGIAAELQANHEKVREAVRLLAEDAANPASSTRMKSAQLLLPYVDQALGKPVQPTEERTPDSAQALESASVEELERLVAEGRRRRMHVAPDGNAESA